MTIKEITERSLWDNFLETNKLGYFLQTWQWGDFLQQGLKKNIYRLGIYNIEDKLVGLCLGSEEISRYGKFIYCARGPIINWENKEIRPKVIHAIREYFKNKGYILLRLDPAIKKENLELHNDFKLLGFQDAVNFIQVERAWMLDLTQS
ncbi:MAG TPA: peptidoglycan bridge formation glycyltransferase FemA/FemB family protein, partial [Candidatus Dojkabacteria bacterium]|nr:peptidoglycan bridge formation glycyltransferase FemA/FemB family protein [Candidatus Dojkabacteria bacterium]